MNENVNNTGTFAPADAPPGGVPPQPVTEQNAPTGYARAVAAGTADDPALVESDITPDHPIYGRFMRLGQEIALDLAALKKAIVRVYDHNGDGFPEYGDIRMDNGATEQHVELPEEIKALANADAPAVPILNPAICQATGLVVERHELVNGVLPQMNGPGRAYGEQFIGKGTHDIGLSNPNAGATARDMASGDKIHERFANLENQVFGDRPMPAQPTNAQASNFGGAVEAQANALEENAADTEDNTTPQNAPTENATANADEVRTDAPDELPFSKPEAQQSATEQTGAEEQAPFNADLVPAEPPVDETKPEEPPVE